MKIELNALFNNESAKRINKIRGACIARLIAIHKEQTLIYVMKTIYSIKLSMSHLRIEMSKASDYTMYNHVAAMDRVQNMRSTLAELEIYKCILDNNPNQLKPTF